MTFPERIRDPHTSQISGLAFDTDCGLPQSYNGDPNGHVAALSSGVPCWDLSDGTHSTVWFSTAGNGTVGGTTWVKLVTGGAAPVQPVTVDNEVGTIAGSRQLTNGLNTTVDTATSGQIKINASGGGSTPFKRWARIQTSYLGNANTYETFGSSGWSTSTYNGFGYETDPAFATSPLGVMYMFFYGTSATTNATVSIVQNNAFTHPELRPTVWAVTGFNPNTTWTNCSYALWFGPTSGSNNLCTSATPTNSVVGFRFNTAAGDTSWQAYSSDGSAHTIVNTGVTPPGADEARIFRIDCTNYPTDIKYYIDEVLVATINTHLPVTNTAWIFTEEAQTLANNTIYLEISSIHIESN